MVMESVACTGLLRRRACPATPPARRGQADCPMHGLPAPGPAIAGRASRLGAGNLELQQPGVGCGGTRGSGEEEEKEELNQGETTCSGQAGAVAPASCCGAYAAAAHGR
jgi:hypothetical protein